VGQLCLSEKDDCFIISATPHAGGRGFMETVKGLPLNAEFIQTRWPFGPTTQGQKKIVKYSKRKSDYQYFLGVTL